MPPACVGKLRRRGEPCSTKVRREPSAKRFGHVGEATCEGGGPHRRARAAARSRRSRVRRQSVRAGRCPPGAWLRAPLAGILANTSHTPRGAPPRCDATPSCDRGCPRAANESASLTFLVSSSARRNNEPREVSTYHVADRRAIALGPIDAARSRSRQRSGVSRSSGAPAPASPTCAASRDAN
jgi:hypothetical protein